MRSTQAPFSLGNFGIARADITPPAGIYHRMWGAASHDRATGVHRPLTATAMVFISAENGEERAILALDHCLLWAREMDELLREVSRRSGFPAEHIVVAFSHTHAAGLMDLSRSNLPGGELIAPYLDGLAATLARLIGEARSNHLPTITTYGVGRCSLAANRDFWDEQSRQYVCGFNPDGPTDDTVLIARMVDKNERLLATVVNYACHPTTLGWENTLISPDFVGSMREVVERATGVPCVFLQGASGDLGPREGFVGDVRVAERNGRQLGHAVLAALEAFPPEAVTQYAYGGPVVSGATLGIWRHRPLKPEAMRQFFWRERRRLVDLPYRPDLPTRESIQNTGEAWIMEEGAALQNGDIGRAAECRAMIERMNRQLTRIAMLPPGPTFPLPVTLWHMGDAVWVAVECEHYNLLQRGLRERFPGVPIVVITLANGSRASYLPAADAYGKGIYQETIAVLARGCLETLLDEISREIEASLKEYREWVPT